MRQPELKILITDGSYKNAISVMKNIRRAYPEAKIYAHCTSRLDRFFIPNKRNYFSVQGSLDDILAARNYDVIIPVSGQSVKKCAALNLENAAVPEKKLLNQAFDKKNLSKFINGSGLLYPTVNPLSSESVSSEFFPFVIKTANETLDKMDAIYINNEADWGAFKEYEKNLKVERENLIAQKRVQGVSRGYFAFFYHGRFVCEFMHERVRQIPHTGGASTSAKSFHDAEISLLAREFLLKKKWHGPVMMEFIYNSAEEKYFLIEINPKLWGSIDLAHCSGVDFGVAIVSSILNDGKFKPRSILKKQVSWVLDGDIVTIFRTRKFSALLSYFRANHTLIFGESLVSIFLKAYQSLKRIVGGG